MAKKDLKKWLEDHPAPESCGVYRFFDESGTVIYVGKSVNLRRRMQQYLAPSRRKKNRKRRTIVAAVMQVDFELCLDEKAALLRENQLIQDLQPALNTAGAFSFLYPTIAALFSERRLALVRTTMPDEYGGFQLYGAFRDRELVKAAFESLEELLGLVGHKEPASRLKDIPKAEYSRRCALREIPDEFWPLLQQFLAGESDEFLRVLFDRLLSTPSAVKQADEVNQCFKTLKQFFRYEASKLREACLFDGRNEVYIAQNERDALFIRVSGS